MKADRDNGNMGCHPQLCSWFVEMGAGPCILVLSNH